MKKLPRWQSKTFPELASGLNQLADAIEDTAPPEITFGQGMTHSSDSKTIVMDSIVDDSDGGTEEEPKKLTGVATVKDGGKAVRIVYGTINGMQPAAMTAGDRIPLVFPVGTDVYIYATATINRRTRQWEFADVISGPKDKKGSKTIAVKLIVSASLTQTGALTVESWEGGDVDFDPCIHLVIP